MPRLLAHKGFVDQVLQRDLLSLTVSIRFSLVLAVCSFVFVLLYVFVLAPYENFLYNDMQGFWQRALERLNGETFRETQFLAWPPWYHIFIAEVLRVFKTLGLDQLIRFEVFLGLNIFVFAISVCAFHRIALKWFDGDARLSLIAALLYGFGFPAWYFNAFLLSDNLSAPLLVIAVALIYLKTDMRSLVAAAVLFAFASVIRPSVAPYGLAFVIALFAIHRVSYKFILRAGVFSAVFFALVFLAMAEVSRISKGKVSGLSANGGLDFFIANSRIYRIDLNYDGWHNFVVVPALSWKPEQGFFRSRVPYYNQDYYYNLGWQYIKHNPSRIVKNIEHVKHLFFAAMLPSRSDAPGFTLFRPVWDVLKFIGFLSAFFFIWLWRDFSLHQKKLAAFMLSTIGITFVVSYLFTGEPRYTYSIMFIFYLIALKVVQFILIKRDRIQHALPRVAALLAGLWLSGKVLAFVVSPSYPSHLQATFSGESNAMPGKNVYLEQLFFPYAEPRALVSADKHLKMYSHGELVLATDLLVEGSTRDLKFDIHSAWPIRIKVDGQDYVYLDQPNFFRETPALLQLEPGKHHIEVIVNYFPIEGGLSLSYSYIDETGWIHRQFLGVDDGPISFSLPESE